MFRLNSGAAIKLRAYSAAKPNNSYDVITSDDGLVVPTGDFSHFSGCTSPSTPQPPPGVFSLLLFVTNDAANASSQWSLYEAGRRHFDRTGRRFQRKERDGLQGAAGYVAQGYTHLPRTPKILRK